MSNKSRTDSRATPPAESEKFDFSCARCGRCCRGEPGHVWVSQAGVGRAARHLGISRDEFFRRYVRVEGRRLSLRELAGGDCVMWDRRLGCRIYPVRPRQCVTFPYWPEMLNDEETLLEADRRCPGIRLKISTR